MPERVDDHWPQNEPPARARPGPWVAPHLSGETPRPQVPLPGRGRASDSTALPWRRPCATLFLIVAGGLVTSTESGLSVPDWPMSYGRLMPPMVGGILFEHAHRLIASTVGLLTIVLAVWLARREPRAWVRRLGYVALAAVVAQGVLGGLTVIFLLPTADLGRARLPGADVLLPRRDARGRDVAAVARAAGTAQPEPRVSDGAATVAVVFLQLLVGAVMRHTKAGLAIPDFPLALGRVVPPLDVLSPSRSTSRTASWALAGRRERAACCVARALRSRRPGLAKTASLSPASSPSRSRSGR